MRYVKYLLIAIIALILVTVAFANRQVVSLTILPQALDVFVGLNPIVGPIELPLYAVVFGGVALGLILGYAFEWLREHKHRRAATDGRVSKATLERQVKEMKDEKNAGRDELVVLVEETAPTTAVAR